MERPPAHELLVQRLLRREEQIAGHLADAVRDAVPAQWGEVVDRDCRPVTHALVPQALACLVDGSALPPESLAQVHARARSNRESGVPATVTMRAMGAALVAFSAEVRDEAALLRRNRAETIAAIATLTGRAPLVLFEIMTVFIDGHGTAGAGSDLQVDHLHPVARQVLTLTAQGLNTRDIAGRLGCSVSNVKYHLAALRRRYRAPNRAALVALAATRPNGDDG